MKTKILLWGVVLILLAGVVAGAYWWLRRPQVIILDNGDKRTLLAVTVAIHKSHFFEFTAKPEKQ
jgi:multidrug resistance efflux pump